jgi:hypothetical protein
VEQEARQGADHMQATNYQQLLCDLEAADAQYLDSLRQQLPIVAQHLTRLRTEGLTILEPDNILGVCLQNIEYLQGLAKQANATPLVTFLTGLQSFLSLIVQRRVAISSQRVQSVEARIGAVVVTIEEWMSAGRQERDAMSRLLPAA